MIKDLENDYLYAIDTIKKMIFYKTKENFKYKKLITQFAQDITNYNIHIEACKDEITDLSGCSKCDKNNKDDQKKRKYHIFLNEEHIKLYNSLIKDTEFMINKYEEKIKDNNEIISHYEKRLSFYIY